VLEAFHREARQLDYRATLEALLGEFRRGAIADPERSHEDAAIRTHLAAAVAAWDRVLPRFPILPGRRRSMTWEYYRGRRDAYLRRLIASQVPLDDRGRRLIVNPATFLGRHARWLARRMPAYEVLGTDIDPNWDRLYRLACFWAYRGPANHRFEREDVFEADLEPRPAAVTFFGACGSVTDGGMDYAIATASPFLICRSCCHDNIGGNTRIVRRPGLHNAFFAWKNRVADRNRPKPKYAGFYVSDRLGENAYPRSAAARGLMDSETILEVARNSVDSDICRFLIDMDRCLFLQEQGYDVLYREELFFAHQRT
jgi:hypothetical protein